MSEKERKSIRKIAVILYQEGKITFEEQMNVLDILREKYDGTQGQEFASAAM